MISLVDTSFLLFSARWMNMWSTFVGAKLPIVTFSEGWDMCFCPGPFLFSIFPFVGTSGPQVLSSDTNKLIFEEHPVTRSIHVRHRRESRGRYLQKRAGTSRFRWTIRRGQLPTTAVSNLPLPKDRFVVFPFWS